MRAFVLIAASLALAACSSNPSATEPGVTVYSQSEVADSIGIRVGKTIIVDGVRIRFDVVESDSRCPMDVVCVWQGDAVARFAVEQSGSSSTFLQLHTSLQPKSGSAYGFRIELLTLQPYPRASAPTKADEYVATIRIVPAS